MAECSAASLAMDGIEDEPRALIGRIIRRNVDHSAGRIEPWRGADFRGANERANSHGRDGCLGTVGQVKTDVLIEAALLQVRQNLAVNRPAVEEARWNGWGGPQAAGENFVRGFEALKCEADLASVVAARHAAGRFASGLDGGQNKRDQNTNDGDHDEQLDEGEALAGRNGELRRAGRHRSRLRK